MMKFKSCRTFLYFAKAYPKRSILMVTSLVVAGLLEGVGIMALLPLVSILTEQESLGNGAVLEIVTAIFHFFNLEVSIAPILIFIVVTISLKALITMLAMVQVAYSSAHVCTDLRLGYMRHLLGANWRHFVALKSGASANALGTEAQRSAISFTQGCHVLSWTVQVIVYTALAFLISWQLTLSAMCAGSVMVYLLSSLVRAGRKAGNEQTKILDSVLTRITDTLYGVKPLKAMGKTKTLLSMMEGEAVTLQSAQRAVDISRHAVRVLSEPIMVFFISIGIYAILTYGNLPVAELLFLALLFLRMVTKVSAVQSAYLSMAANESALWSLKAKIDTAKEAADINEGNLEASFEKSIRLENVCFSYDEDMVLNNISLDLPCHGLYVLFGPSGEGKTTLLDLIIGLHKPTSGQIYVDQDPLHMLDINSWRNKIGYVPQDVLLFHDTIMNNVTLNNPNISKEDVIEALKTADAYDFVIKMDNGLDSIVGERGAKISGGQRQRIAIARALVGKPSILILDEATSALDKATEKDLLITIKALSKDILILAISHNPASLNCADTVLRLQNGSLEKLSPENITRLAV